MGAVSMLKVWAIVVAALAAGAIAPVRAGEPPSSSRDLVKARLVPEVPAIAPGMVLWVDLHLEMKPGWHTYWRNPGDAGLPTTIKWSLPPGFSPGEIRWPTPQHFVQGDAGSYGYTGAVDLLAPLTPPKSLGLGQQVRLTAETSWLVCKTICIPGGAKLSLDLPAAAARLPPDPAVALLFAAARRRLPVLAPFETRFAELGRDLRVIVPASALSGLRDPTGTFFPFDDTLIDNAAEPRVERGADGLHIILKKSPTADAHSGTLKGVLVLRADGGVERAFDISANAALPLPAKTSFP